MDEIINHKGVRSKREKKPIISDDRQVNLRKPSSVVLDRYKEVFTYPREDFDRSINAFLSQFVSPLSPVSYQLAFSDWLGHLLYSPGRQMDVFANARQRYIELALYLLQYYARDRVEPFLKPRPNDHRFDYPLWSQFPFNFYCQLFLVQEQIVDDLTSRIHGVSKHHHHFVNFMTRQMLDLFSPSNFVFLNPEVLVTIFNQKGMNFINGYFNFLEDSFRYLTKQPPAGSENFIVGKDVAITPGKVIYRNRLMELIQYEPATKTVYAEPILFIPAWIMKYYILDLSPQNSLVNYLVQQGHTVFMISWKNPTADDRNLTLEDYIDLGMMSALDVINEVLPERKIHAVGYCIGGTLLMIAAAAMAKRSDDRLKTVSTFAAQIDFIDAGELLLLIDEAQINYLEDSMWRNGYLDGAQMSGTFSMLRATDLIFSRAIHDYLLGNRKPITDLMAWDYDTTRLPYKMHIEYLRKLFLSNDLVQGRFNVWGASVVLPDLKAPVFCVSTKNDHVAPWKSVYKIHYFTNVDVTFVLASRGHNTGIISEPGLPERSFQILTHQKEDKHFSAEHWQEVAPYHEGSWWPAWNLWLVQYSTERIAPPPMGNPEKGYRILRDAPGSFVFEK